MKKSLNYLSEIIYASHFENMGRNKRARVSKNVVLFSKYYFHFYPFLAAFDPDAMALLAAFDLTAIFILIAADPDGMVLCTRFDPTAIMALLLPYSI